MDLTNDSITVGVRCLGDHEVPRYQTAGRRRLRPGRRGRRDRRPGPARPGPDRTRVRRARTAISSPSSPAAACPSGGSSSPTASACSTATTAARPTRPGSWCSTTPPRRSPSPRATGSPRPSCCRCRGCTFVPLDPRGRRGLARRLRLDGTVGTPRPRRPHARRHVGRADRSASGPYLRLRTRSRRRRLRQVDRLARVAVAARLVRGAGTGRTTKSRKPAMMS